MARCNPTEIKCTEIRRSWSLRALVVMIGLLASVPAAAGNADSGRTLAERWCTGCHIIGNPVLGSDMAPPFTAIAADSEKGREQLEAWLATPHTGMPSMPLSRWDIDDLVTYIESLAP